MFDVEFTVLSFRFTDRNQQHCSEFTVHSSQNSPLFALLPLQVFCLQFSILRILFANFLFTVYGSLFTESSALSSLPFLPTACTERSRSANCLLFLPLAFSFWPLATSVRGSQFEVRSWVHGHNNLTIQRRNQQPATRAYQFTV